MRPSFQDIVGSPIRIPVVAFVARPSALWVEGFAYITLVLLGKYSYGGTWSVVPDIMARVSGEINFLNALQKRTARCTLCTSQWIS